MSHTIWRYKLEARTTQEIEMPWGAKVLRFGVKDGAPSLWVLVDCSEPARTQREFRLYATGEEIPDASQMIYCGTIVGEQQGKAEIIHCFEVLRIVV